MLNNMKKLIKNPMFYIPVIGLLIMYGPGMIARSIHSPEPEDIVWSIYCQDNGIDPNKATEEQKDQFMDVFMETDEYQELLESVSTTL